MKEFNAKKKTALLAVNILLSILLVMSMCVTVALAVTQFSLNMGGNISFQAKDVQATISEGIVANGTVAGENKMKEIELTPDNDVSPDISSWSGLEISFAGKEDVTITFKVTNNHTEEALLFTANVNEGTKNNNMTMSMTIDGENKTEVIIPANTNSNDNEVECVVTFKITDKTKSASLTGFAIDCDLKAYETHTVTILLKDYQIGTVLDNTTISIDNGGFYYLYLGDSSLENGKDSIEKYKNVNTIRFGNQYFSREPSPGILLISIEGGKTYELDTYEVTEDIEITKDTHITISEKK